MNDKKIAKSLTTIPIIIYTIFLIILPLMYIFIISFYKSDNYGGMIITFTFDNYIKLFGLVYMKVFLKSFLIAGIVTLLCVLISYPLALVLNKQSARFQEIAIVLVNIPFIANSLLRMYGWVILLRKEGLVNHFLETIHLINEPLNLMYNNIGTIVGLTYVLLPFMIVPVYNAVHKLDPKLLEASSDLGATKLQTFKNVMLPLTASGIFSGAIMTFIPAIGYFFVADILGGAKFMLIGNLIKNQFLTARNWPFGAAISIFLLIFTFILVKVYQLCGGNMDDLGGA